MATDATAAQAGPDGRVDKDVTDRLDRGRRVMRVKAPERNLCFRFWQGRHYFYLDEKGQLAFQDTVTHVNGAGKPRHRIRTTRNLIHGLVEDKVSNSTQRTPGYDVSPASTDPQDAAAAQLARKVAYYGYDRWRIRRARIKAVTHAFVADGGYIMPFFDANVGPFVTDPQTGRTVGQGEIRLLVLSGNEVFWEPGVDFDDSRWHAIERARPVEDVKADPGYAGPADLKADAQTQDTPSLENHRDNLVVVTEYFERPSAARPDGRKVTIANRRRIRPDEAYPCRDMRGRVVDEPVIHRITYTTDPTLDRDRGLVVHLIDPQRTYNDCVAGETLVRTARGLMPARDLAGQAVLTLTIDGTYRVAHWANYGKRRLWRVRFEDGEEIHASERHEWIVNRKGRGNSARVQTPQLVGERVPVVSRSPALKIEDRDAWLHGVQHGLVYGDGTVARYYRGEKTYVYGRLTQYGDGCALVERFFPGHHGPRKTVDGREQITTYKLDPALKALPSGKEPPDYLRGFLAGALAADGSVTDGGAVLLSSAKRGDLEQIRDWIGTTGVTARPVREARGGTSYNPDGHLYSLGFSKAAFVSEDGVSDDLILRDFHAAKLAGSLGENGVRMTTKRVVAVEPTGRVEDTYCCEEPITQSWVTGSGVVTSNCVNKILEWKNRALNPRILAPVGSLINPPTDEPGGVDYYRPVGGQVPAWQQTPQIPGDLFSVMSQARQDMETIAAAGQIVAGSNVAAATAQAQIEQQQNRWSAFLQDLAEFDSRLMRHCLYLAGRYYTEQRLLEIRGRYGWESPQAFQGADLRGQAHVTVMPDSLVPRSRQQIRNDIQLLAQIFPGHFRPEQIIAAMYGGVGEQLIQSYELDVAKANQAVQTIAAGVDAAMSLPRRWDPDTPDPQTGRPGTWQPGWMPSSMDNLDIWRQVVGDFTKTDLFAALTPPAQEMIGLIWDAIKQLEQQRAAQQAMMQTQMAQQMGMANAAAPQPPRQMPSMPAQAPAAPAGPAAGQ